MPRSKLFTFKKQIDTSYKVDSESLEILSRVVSQIFFTTVLKGGKKGGSLLVACSYPSSVSYSRRQESSPLRSIYTQFIPRAYCHHDPGKSSTPFHPDSFPFSDPLGPSSYSITIMPVVLSSQMAHFTSTQADLDFLDLLTLDESSLGPLRPANNGNVNAHASSSATANGGNKVLPRRESHMDALLLSAVLAGSGPVTRHHLGHGIGALESATSGSKTGYECQ